MNSFKIFFFKLIKIKFMKKILDFIEIFIFEMMMIFLLIDSI
jgi:hypothetical protein